MLPSNVTRNIYSPFSSSLLRWTGAAGRRHTHTIEQVCEQCNNCSIYVERGDGGYDFGRTMSRRAAPLVSGATVAPPRQLPLTRRIVKTILRPYLRIYHHLEIHGTENIPPRGPALVVV